jgi:COP9 signalosome complex subunit 3
MAARRKYAAALELFLLALAAPTYVVNAIAVAAYKKYVLVSLIHYGAGPS